ncbi:MAG: ArnT family glycosyltransferase [Promethearchaeota archaeon]
MNDFNEPSRQNSNKIKTFFIQKWWIFALISIVIVSFCIDMYALMQYSISYGPDGPYYDLQVREILNTGFPDSNDPPLVYYYLVPFVIITGNSYFGIKLGMSLISSLIAIPAFLLTEIFAKKAKITSRIPALLSAFMVTINIYYLRMIEDFMQNLVGTFFLLFFMYFAVKWFENFEEWKKYGVITCILLVCNILTHIYTGAVAIVLFVALFFFAFILKWIRTKQIPKYELKILILLIGIVAVAIVGLIFIFPTIYTNFYSRISGYVNTLTSNDTETDSPYRMAFMVFITIPYILGLASVVLYLYKGLFQKRFNNNNNDAKPIIPKELLLIWLYFVLAVLIFVLVIIPSNWQERFILLAFVPISLAVSFGLLRLEVYLSKKYDNRKGKRYAIVGIIAFLFAFSSLYSAISIIPRMGPIITEDQYNELVKIKEKLIGKEIDQDGVMHVDDVHFGYWVEYIFEMDVDRGDINQSVEEYPNRTIYHISPWNPVESPFKMSFLYPWDPIFPYTAPFYDFFMPTKGDYSAPDNKEPPPEETKIQLNEDKPPPPKIMGILIFHGEYYDILLCYYSNGTQAKL